MLWPASLLIILALLSKKRTLKLKTDPYYLKVSPIDKASRAHSRNIYLYYARPKAVAETAPQTTRSRNFKHLPYTREGTRNTRK
jgi:hypothetical protein